MDFTRTPRISICITTLNRAHIIGETLGSIVSQITDDCELVVVDGASTDETELVVSGYARCTNNLRYVRLEVNGGIDRDYDCAVRLARGEYCWLMSDDDFLMPGAIAEVLRVLRDDWSLVGVDVEARSSDMSEVVQSHFLRSGADRAYEPGDIDGLFSDVSEIAKYMGWIIIKREIWIERDIESYFGTLFSAFGVIFQKPLPGRMLVMARPLVSYRSGMQHTFSPKHFETFAFSWSKVVWSSALSEQIKRKFCPADSWRRLATLSEFRALGVYGLNEYLKCVRPRLRSTYQKLIPLIVAIVPGTLCNLLLICYLVAIRRSRSGYLLYALRQSRFYPSNWELWELFKRQTQPERLNKAFRRKRSVQRDQQ